MKILVVIQARTGSSRLPNKIMKPLAGAPLLLRMVERVQAAKTDFACVVATTTDASDEPVRALCRAHEIDCYSGHATDLLDRHFRAAEAGKADVVVKIPSDCPLIDPAVIDRVIGHYLEHVGEYDFVSNLHPQSWPDGHDVEVMSTEMLELAWREARAPHEREHTTPFFWDQPERFRIGNVVWGAGRDLSMSHRFTIDYAEDYAFVRAVYDELWSEAHPVFSLDDVLGLLERRPDIFELNVRFAGVNWYRNHLDALRTVTADETRQPREERA